MKRSIQHTTAIAILFLLPVLSTTVYSQSVGIAGTAITPDAQSILDIQTTAKGVLLPRMTTAQRDAIGATGSSDYGLLIFNITTSTYDYWDGSTWQQVGTGTGSASTLDDAYDNSGSGSGRTIIADAGAVNITGADGLTVNGNIGVGTLAPTQKLHVVGNVMATGNGEFDGNITLLGNNRDLTTADNFDVRGTSNIDIQIDSDANTANSEFRVLNGANAQVMRLQEDGNITFSGLGGSGNRLVYTDNSGLLYSSDDIPGSDADYIQNQNTSAQTVANYWINGNGRMDGGLTVGAGATVDNNNTNTGTIANGALAFGNASGEGIGSKRNAGGNQNGLDLYTNSINRMAITNSGNVGIGISTGIDRKLKVSGSGWTAIEIEETGASDAALELTSAGGSSYIFTQNAGYLGLQSPTGQELRLLTNGGTEQMRIESGGNVGIGTTTPDAKLNVGDANGATIYLTREDNITVANDILGSLLFDSTDDTQSSNNDASAVIRGHASQNHGNSNKGGYLTFLTKDNVPYNTSATERMRIAADGNVGIGTNGPTQVLDVDGQIRMRGTSGTAGYVPVSAADGTMTWTDPTTVTTADDGDWVISGNNIYNGNSGNVGVGTTSPDNKLSVQGVSGGTGFGGSNGTGGVRVEWSTGFGVALDAWDGGSPRWGITAFNANSPTVMMEGRYNSTDVIFNAGNVGIGTTAPTGTLHIAGTNSDGTPNVTGVQIKGGENASMELTGTATPFIDFQNDVAGTDFDMRIRLTGDDALAIEGGNMGIGTTAPTQQLDVNGAVRIRGGAPATGRVLMSTDGNGNAAWADPAVSAIEYTGTVTAGNWYRIAQNNTGGRRAAADFTVRCNISGGGHSTLMFSAGISYNDATNMSFTMRHHNWYINRTFTKVRILEAGTYDIQYVEVYCVRSGSVRFSIDNNMSDDPWNPVPWTAGGIPGGYTAREYDVDKLFVVGDSDDRFTIAKGGNVGIGFTTPTYKLHVNGRLKTTGINETSDRRLKKNIRGIESPLNKVLRMKGVTYEWKIDEHPGINLEEGKQYGLIAQELEEIIPELVDTEADGEKWKSIEYSHLVPVLIEAIKELTEKVGAQGSTIGELKAQLIDVKRNMRPVGEDTGDIYGALNTENK